MKLLDTSCHEEFMQWVISNDTQNKAMHFLVNIVAEECQMIGLNVIRHAILNWLDRNAKWVWYHIEVEDCSFDPSKIIILLAGYPFYTDKSFSEIPSLKKALQGNSSK